MGGVSFLVVYVLTYSASSTVTLLLLLKTPLAEDLQWLALWTLWLALPLGMAIDRASRLDLPTASLAVILVNLLAVAIVFITLMLLARSLPSESTDLVSSPDPLSEVVIALLGLFIFAVVILALSELLASTLAQIGLSLLLEAPWSILFGFGRAKISVQHLTTHPAFWDEAMMVPAPRLAFFLKCGLIADETQGLVQIRRIAANPFQRWAVQRAVCDYVAVTRDPLGFMYRVLRDPRLDEYILEPVTAVQHDKFATARAVVLGEWAHTFTDATQGLIYPPEVVAYGLTKLFRRRQMTPLSQFARFSYQFLDEDTFDADQFDLLQYEPIYAGIRSYPHGEEVYLSFAALAALLRVTDIVGIAASTGHLAWLDTISESPLRHEVLEALRALGDVSAEVSQCRHSTSRAYQAAALSRAAGALNELATYLQEKIYPPEQTLLACVVRQWQSIVAEAQGRLGEETLREMTPQVRRAAGIIERRATIWRRPATPLPNPYKAGDPVYPPLLVGRKDVFNRVSEVWSAKENPDSIILYGHRRMGKTSILRNLDQYAPPGSILVYLDLKGVTSFVQSTADLLLGLADAIYGAVCRILPASTVPAPHPTDYGDPARAQFHLDRLLRQVQGALAGHQLILALDEFEAIEEAVQEGRVGREIYQYLRAKTQEPWLTIVFAGLHTLDEMSREYQEPFYGSYANICVSYLSPKTARRLITNPTPEFLVNYDSDVVERIVAETYGQPMLVQCICQELINHLNYTLFDLGQEREVRITQQDLHAVLTDDFIRDETRYFDGVWSQVKDDPVQVAVLAAMARGPDTWTVGDLVDGIELDVNSVQNALEQLRRRDILAPLDEAPDRWHFLMPLMRRWIILYRE